MTQWLIVVVRLWCRRIQKLSISIEDWLHLTALIFFYGQIATCFISVVLGGAGHHVYELEYYHIVQFSQVCFPICLEVIFLLIETIQAILATQILYALAIGFVKISITVMLMRLFIHRNVQIAGKFVIIISISWMIMTCLVPLLLCKPVQKNWDPATAGTCGNSYVAFGIVAGIDIFNELCLIILPMPSLFKLYMHRRYKFALACVFGTGIMYVVSYHNSIAKRLQPLIRFVC